ncbi:hypothetical protein M9979_08035 [Sphingomonas sp. RP10(2022)]|uniref:Uncharacterized protein n=1 Tax=Sphingomonas liriopis TaxID=2949094 RepID=A0A9X2KTE6_9SPHN|nr:hypothetical protein [Sphingomonas liriopis]MCP3734818.1 hypothetical protein [Sphingomonas liriopis]
MLPSPRLFRSRWTALLWAGGILWFAHDVAGSAPSGTGNSAALTDADGDAANVADLRALANVIDQ